MVEKVYRMHDPPHPGEIIREEYLKPLDLSVSEASEKLGVSVDTLSSLVDEKSGISVEMALRLSKAFTTSAEMWLNMQNQYDLFQYKDKVDLENVQVLYE